MGSSAFDLAASWPIGIVAQRWNWYIGLWNEPVTELLPLPKDCAALLPQLTGHPINQCPLCPSGTLHRIQILMPIRYRAPAMDSS